MRYFSEYLQNIDRISINFDQDTSHVSYIGSNSVCFNNSIIKLPGEVKLFEPVDASKQIRLQAKTVSKHKQNDLLFSSNFYPPNCICGCTLVPNTKWKPLPSEHWAELMDIWHCHKPENGFTQQNTLYELAINGFHPTTLLSLYSDTYYLVHKDSVLRSVNDHSNNCPIIEKVNRNESQTVKLWKWDLDTNTPISKLMGTIFKELIDAHAVFTFELNSDMIIWVLNTEISYTASFTESDSPQKAAKILFGSIELRGQRPDAESVSIPTDIYLKFKSEVESINQNLPQHIQQLGKWKLSLL